MTPRFHSCLHFDARLQSWKGGAVMAELDLDTVTKIVVLCVKYAENPDEVVLHSPGTQAHVKLFYYLLINSDIKIRDPSVDKLLRAGRTL